MNGWRDEQLAYIAVDKSQREDIVQQKCRLLDDAGRVSFTWSLENLQAVVPDSNCFGECASMVEVFGSL